MSMRIPDHTMTHHRFSLSKVIRILMRIPEDIIACLCFSYVEGNLNINENT